MVAEVSIAGFYSRTRSSFDLSSLLSNLEIGILVVAADEVARLHKFFKYSLAEWA